MKPSKIARRSGEVVPQSPRAKAQVQPLRKQFTARDRQQLSTLLPHLRDAKAYRRAHAVLLYAQGHTAAEAGQANQLSYVAVYRYAKRYLQSRHSSAFVDRPRAGRPSLAATVSPELLRQLLSQTPWHYGYASNVWTVALLTQHLHDHHGLTLSPATLRQRLHDLGWRFKRPRYFYAERAPHIGQKKGACCVA